MNKIKNFLNINKYFNIKNISLFKSAKLSVLSNIKNLKKYLTYKIFFYFAMIFNFIKIIEKKIIKSFFLIIIIFLYNLIDKSCIYLLNEVIFDINLKIDFKLFFSQTTEPEDKNVKWVLRSMLIHPQVPISEYKTSLYYKQLIFSTIQNPINQEMIHLYDEYQALLNHFKYEDLKQLSDNYQIFLKQIYDISYGEKTYFYDLNKRLKSAFYNKDFKHLAFTDYIKEKTFYENLSIAFNIEYILNIDKTLYLYSLYKCYSMNYFIIKVPEYNNYKIFSFYFSNYVTIIQCGQQVEAEAAKLIKDVLFNYLVGICSSYEKLKVTDWLTFVQNYYSSNIFDLLPTIEFNEVPILNERTPVQMFNGVIEKDYIIAYTTPYGKNGPYYLIQIIDLEDPNDYISDLRTQIQAENVVLILFIFIFLNVLNRYFPS